MSDEVPGYEAGYVFRDRYPERTEVYRRFDEASAAARQTHGCRLDIRYGPHPRETFDLFTGKSGAPLVVFVHGGYWQSLDKQRFSFVALPLVARGFAVALPNYPLAPESPPEAIVGSVTRCLPAVLGALGAAPSSIIATGHSAGGHLAAMLSLGHPVAACVPISGIFDVAPLLHTSVNAALALDAARAAAISPISRPPRRGCRLVALVGGDETAAFTAQSESYVRHWRDGGEVAELVSLGGRNHYTVLCDLLEERSRIVAEIVRAADAFRREERGIERS
ncbi:MAG: alpha/beta hydrolase [Rhizobiaceae bacterium]|nr:alpha/beta hydrolase [Rhizobiaceae bacterium]